MDEYDMEDVSDPENEVYKSEEDEDNEDDYDDEEAGEDELEEELEEEGLDDEDYDDEDFDENDKYDRDDGLSMSITDLEKLYEIKNGKIIKRPGVVNEFETKEPKNKK
jgi:hypothetical protein